MKSKIKVLLKIFFGIYVLILVCLLFLKGIRIRSVRMDFIQDYGFWQAVKFCINLVPFRTITDYMERMDDISINSINDFAFQNLAGNIVLFMPWGVFFPYFWEKQRNFFRFFITAFLAILCIEFTQLLTFLGVFDVDDLLLNLIGCCIGFGVFYLIKPVLLQKNN